MYMRRTNYIHILVVLLLFAPLRSWSQETRTDTLSLKVFFKRNASEVEPGYRNNGPTIKAFSDSLKAWLADPDAKVHDITIRTAASPEGRVDANRKLSQSRADGIKRYLSGLGVNSPIIRYDAVGEDWDGLQAAVAALDVPWRDAALEIMKDPSNRKKRLMDYKGGSVWRWLDEHIFPDLRSGGGGIHCVVERKALPRTDTVYVTEPAEPQRVVDTVYIAEKIETQRIDTVYIQERVEPLRIDTVYITEKPEPVRQDTVFVYLRDTVFQVSYVPAPAIPEDDFPAGRRMLFALRTNALAIPFANFGVEVPLSPRWSVAADYYYPWIWRENHKTGLDYQGYCNELLAWDVEGRYWFPGKNVRPTERLLGHSIGAYLAGGYYDFERNFTGHQGWFTNIGIDYLYAVPVFKRRAHFEFELGLGWIYSKAQPFDTFIAGDKAYRRKGVITHVNWFGPTRVGISLVIPIYTKKQVSEQ